MSLCKLKSFHIHSHVLTHIQHIPSQALLTVKHTHTHTHTCIYTCTYTAKIKQLIKPSAHSQLGVCSEWHLRAVWLSSLNRIRHNRTSLQGEGSDVLTPGLRGHGWIGGMGCWSVSQTGLRKGVKSCSKWLKLTYCLHISDIRLQQKADNIQVTEVHVNAMYVCCLPAAHLGFIKGSTSTVPW